MPPIGDTFRSCNSSVPDKMKGHEAYMQYWVDGRTWNLVSWPPSL